MDIEIKDIPQEVILKGLDKVMDILIKKYDDLGLRASGQWANNLEGIVQDGKGVILGLDYTEQLVHGRPPGKHPKIKPLIEWVSVKLGITGELGVSTAFAVASKIAQEGTEIYKQGGTDLLEVLDEPETMAAFVSAISEYMAEELRKRILNEFKNLE